MARPNVARQFRPSAWRQAHRPTVVKLDLVRDNGIEYVNQYLGGPIITAICSAIVADELFERHLILHLRIVLIGVQHNYTVRQHVRRVRIRYGVRVRFIITRSKTFEYARNFLCFSGELESRQKGSQSSIKRDISKVKELGVLIQNRDNERRGLTEVVADDFLI